MIPQEAFVTNLPNSKQPVVLFLMSSALKASSD